MMTYFNWIRINSLLLPIVSNDVWQGSLVHVHRFRLHVGCGRGSSGFLHWFCGGWCYWCYWGSFGSCGWFGWGSTLTSGRGRRLLVRGILRWVVRVYKFKVTWKSYEPATRGETETKAWTRSGSDAISKIVPDGVLQKGWGKLTGVWVGDWS